MCLIKSLFRYYLLVSCREYVISFRIEEGGRGFWAILKNLGWNNIVNFWCDPLPKSSHLMYPLPKLTRSIPYPHNITEKKERKWSFWDSFSGLLDMDMNLWLAQYPKSHWYLGKNDLCQADKSIFPGVNHSWVWSAMGFIQNDWVMFFFQYQQLPSPHRGCGLETRLLH